MAPCYPITTCGFTVPHINASHINRKCQFHRCTRTTAIQLFHGRQRHTCHCRDPGSNQGPSDLQSDALPTELSRPKIIVLRQFTTSTCNCVILLHTECNLPARVSQFVHLNPTLLKEVKQPRTVLQCFSSYVLNATHALTTQPSQSHPATSSQHMRPEPLLFLGVA